PLTVALRGAEEVRDWVPTLGDLGLRLARRCWPGPMTLVCPRGADGVGSRLPDGVHRSVCPGGGVAATVPYHAAARLLAERLGCPAAELPRRGFIVVSAGLAAPPGEPAAAEAAEVVREYGGDLGGHATRPVTADLLAQADDVLAMTAGHLQALAAFPG